MPTWTTPKTWDALETLTSTNMNVQVRDNLLHLKEGLAISPNYAKIEYTGSLSVALAGSWADIVAANPTAYQVTITPRSASSLLLCSFRIGISLSAGADILFSVRVDGSGNSGVMSIPAFTSGSIAYDWITTQSAASHTFKPMWQIPAGRTLTKPPYYSYFSVLEIGPIEP